MATRHRTPVSPLERILVAVDFSTNAVFALERTALLPLAGQAHLHLVHVLPATLPATARSALAGEASEALGKAEQLLRRRVGAAGGPQVRITSELRFGKPYAQVIQASRAQGAELIVLGRFGAVAVGPMTIGSTADRVVRVADRPVLVVTLKPRGPYRRPLVAIAADPTASPAAEAALRIAGRRRPIAALHALDPVAEGIPSAASARLGAMRRAAARKLDRLLKVQGRGKDTFALQVLAGDARVVIRAAAISRRADVVVLGMHTGPGTVHTLLGSVAEWILSTAPCDVLVARTRMR